MTEFERSLLIVQLRCEIASDSAKAFREGARSKFLMSNEMRNFMRSVAEGYELQSKLLKSTLDLVQKK